MGLEDTNIWYTILWLSNSYSNNVLLYYECIL